MWGMYWVASDMQNAETKFLSMIYLKDRNYLICGSVSITVFYVGNANHADGKGIVVANAKSLVKKYLDSADESYPKEGAEGSPLWGTMVM